MAAHHWRHGWMFERLPDGTVSILNRTDERFAGSMSIPPDEWASIVAHLADGGSAEAYSQAQALHNRQAGN